VKKSSFWHFAFFFIGLLQAEKVGENVGKWHASKPRLARYEAETQLLRAFSLVWFQHSTTWCTGCPATLLSSFCFPPHPVYGIVFSSIWRLHGPVFYLSAPNSRQTQLVLVNQASISLAVKIAHHSSAKNPPNGHSRLTQAPQPH